MTGHFDKQGNTIVSEEEFFVWIQYREGGRSELVSLTITRKLPIEFVPSNFQGKEILDSGLSENVPSSIAL